MANIEILKGQLTDELYEQLNTALADKNLKLGDLATGEYINKDKYNREVGEFTNKLKGYEDYEQIKANLETLTSENANLKTEYDAHKNQFGQLQKDSQIDLALAKAGVSDAFALSGIKASIQAKGLEVNEVGELQGLNEVLEEIKKTSPQHFGVGNLNINGGANPPVVADTTDYSKFTYSERCELFKKNPTKYKEVFGR